MKNFYASGLLDKRPTLVGSSLKSAIASATRQSDTVANTHDDRPTPLDFDAFIPWVFLQWQVPETVVVKRMKQEEFKSRIQTTTKLRSSKGPRVKHSGQESAVSTQKLSSIVTDRTSATYIHEMENALILYAYYDTRGRLMEIAIIGSRSSINRKIIQAFNLCLPFHSFLNKLTIRKGGLNAAVLYEINKMLPHSNITDICFDDSFVPEGNYYILLEQMTHLRYLSLKRCKINNLICKELAAKLDYGCPASTTLLMLDLASNFITDAGAQAFGRLFRKNRHLLYINLSGNQITDIGVEGLFEHLQQFPLTVKEIVETKRRKFEYLENKVVVYKTCLDNILGRQKTEEFLSLSAKRMSVVSKSKATKKKKNDLSAAEEADNMTNAIVGEFDDLFSSQNVVHRDGYTYCIGNLTLCYINLSYTYLEFPSVKKILSVLRYQNDLLKTPPATGLLKVVLEGNEIVNASTELHNIDVYLRKAITDQAPERHFSQKAHHMSLPSDVLC